MKTIIFAGGCFWGVEAYFSQLKGVLDTSVGYVDGNMRKPSYDQVCNGKATHTEACQVFYDENVMTLDWIDGISIRETEELKKRNLWEQEEEEDDDDISDVDEIDVVEENNDNDLN